MRLSRVLILTLLAVLPHPARPAEIPVVDKTLVAWVSPANLTQRGGSVLTLETPAAHFDAIVLGELASARWMAGSDFHRRTLRSQEGLAMETAKPGEWVQVAVVQRGQEVTVYRQGAVYSRHVIEQPQVFGEDSFVLMGPRHRGQPSFFVGEIDEARVYASALTGEQIAALKPSEEGPFKPWAWWTFDDAAGLDRTGRFAHSRWMGGAEVRGGRLVLPGDGATFLASRQPISEESGEAPLLHYHLLHPGGPSLPGDPNAAFQLDGVYHLHYILGHAWKGGGSFSFVHVTSPDLLHWTWQPTRLQPAFTGHGMFSGTGFLTREGRPAVIYHGQGSDRNQIALALDRQLSGWEKPYPVQVRQRDGTEARISHWDPDCFLIGDTYYAISGGENPPLMKSKDLKEWTLVGDFLRHDFPDVARGEDISCPNFFKLGNQWMLLCISHDLGCRYYLGDWDEKAEQFVPRQHGRMNWRRENQSLFSRESWRADFFAPESVLTADGRRVMWAWCATADRTDGRMSDRTLQSLPRELSLPEDGVLRIRPVRELESLRHDGQARDQVVLTHVDRTLFADRAPAGTNLFDLEGEAVEIRVVIPRAEAERKLFGFSLFAGGKDPGLPIVLRPETGALRVGTAEAPFSVAALPPGEDVELRIFVDRYVVEVFANDRQALLAVHPDHRGKPGFRAFTVGAPTTLRRVEWWKLRPTNQGFLEAQKNRVWEPATR